MKLKTVLLSTAASLSLAGAADASHPHGWYLGAELGASWVQDDDIQIRSALTSPTTPSSLPVFFNTANLSFDTGWALLATGGWGYTDSHWRVEAEFGFRHNAVKAATVSHSTVFAAEHLNEFSLMVNVLYDFDLGDAFALSLGAGIGGDLASIEAVPFEDDRWNYAYQGIAGLSYALSSSTDLTLNYRYLVVGDVEFADNVPGALVSLDMNDLQKQTLTLGVRYTFQKEEVAPPPPPPPPPPAPAPPPAHFIVFFGFNKCNITAEADGVLAEAAAAAKEMGSATVAIVGHTDTSGSPRYNQKLSECRANAAKSNLVGKGVAEASISTIGKGETELMVQTGDGVKEPQNRRATIDLH